MVREDHRIGIRNSRSASQPLGRFITGPVGLVGALAVAGAWAGCGASGNQSTSQRTTLAVPGGGSTNGTGSGGNSGGGAAAADGVPCEVSTALQNGCLGCHGHPTAGGAPLSLVTYAELTAVSAIDPTKTQVERSVIRMKDANGPMPPKPAPASSPAEVSALESWIAAGVPHGTCGGAGGAGAGGSGQQTGVSDAGADGVPCDVATVFGASCLNCHGHPLSNGANVGLVTWDELTAMSPGYPGVSVAERSVVRMQKGDMPPAGQGGAVSAANIALVQAWIGAGMQKGSCGMDAGASVDAGPDPFAGPSVCSSGQYWNGGENSRMAPGRACVACHAQEGEGPMYSIAGTVFPTGHEPDDCKAPGAADAVVVITDKNGKSISLPVNSVGNFTYEGYVATPYTAKVVFNGGERLMFKAQTNGDCNTCHTKNGTQGAPGRILLP